MFPSTTASIVAVSVIISSQLATPKQELKVLRGKRFHGTIIRIDRRVDHVSFLLLEKHHATLDRILDAKTRDGTRTGLPNTMATIS